MRLFRWFNLILASSSLVTDPLDTRLNCASSELKIPARPGLILNAHWNKED